MPLCWKRGEKTVQKITKAQSDTKFFDHHDFVCFNFYQFIANNSQQQLLQCTSGN